MANLVEFPVIDLKATGENILRLRLERQLTIRELQVYFGFEEPTAIYRWQRGDNLPSLDNMVALSKLFGVAIEEILVLEPLDVTGEKKMAFSNSRRHKRYRLFFFSWPPEKKPMLVFEHRLLFIVPTHMANNEIL